MSAEGNPVCTLKEHKVIAGCTSVVMIKYGNDLIVANAGDSRAVLCRADGEAYPLSYDHKPAHIVEKRRIENAGGYINQVGRINGNLNLSRSLGDLKYKAVLGLDPAEQMITAEPDITITPMVPSDEFVIIGCDGIWDVLTSQQACDFVRQRLSVTAGSPPPTLESIVEDVCVYCLSENPKKDTGLGTDNMTCMIILLHEDTRHANSEEMAVEEEGVWCMCICVCVCGVCVVTCVCVMCNTYHIDVLVD
jgi:serine/threonine protein phosphatase PrpC